jgi:hypothetical protein
MSRLKTKKKPKAERGKKQTMHTPPTLLGQIVANSNQVFHAAIMNSVHILHRLLKCDGDTALLAITIPTTIHSTDRSSLLHRKCDADTTSCVVNMASSSPTNVKPPVEICSFIEIELPDTSEVSVKSAAYIAKGLLEAEKLDVVDIHNATRITTSSRIVGKWNVYVTQQVYVLGQHYTAWCILCISQLLSREPPPAANVLMNAEGDDDMRHGGKTNRAVPQAFLSHNWSKDKQGRNTHGRVKQLNTLLKQKGCHTWFDEQGDMKGDTMHAMTTGIDESDVILVFITRDYIEKCKKKTNDNCKLEFQYAYNRKGATNMIPVVMENDVLNPATWDGPVGAALGTKLYVDLTGDMPPAESKIQEIISEIYRCSNKNQVKLS